MNLSNLAQIYIEFERCGPRSSAESYSEGHLHGLLTTLEEEGIKCVWYWTRNTTENENKLLEYDLFITYDLLREMSEKDFMILLNNMKKEFCLYEKNEINK